MTIFKNKHFIGVLWVLVTALFGAAILTIAFSYFNTAEINSLSTGCYEAGGKVILEIHNNITSSYSFECKK
ncbi:hypothetical protein [Psychrobacillus sp.]|uniref:hypothetical protein n=1 Tax=Psychrobacillus sp. TaxID=1871623 RepID=UPI0028BF13E6|nr:hypothetical protein [Psychrobacillus sp.]